MKTKQDIANKRKAKQMAKNLLPGLNIYNQYIKHSKNYCQILKNSYVGLAGFPIEKVELIHSDLFHREYLVGFVDPNWLSKTAPGCNAIATPGLDIGELKSPPIVLVATNKNIKKNSSLHSK